MNYLGRLMESSIRKREETSIYAWVTDHTIDNGRFTPSPRIPLSLNDDECLSATNHKSLVRCSFHKKSRKLTHIIRRAPRSAVIRVKTCSLRTHRAKLRFDWTCTNSNSKSTFLRFSNRTFLPNSSWTHNIVSSSCATIPLSRCHETHSIHSAIPVH